MWGGRRYLAAVQKWKLLSSVAKIGCPEVSLGGYRLSERIKARSREFMETRKL